MILRVTPLYPNKRLGWPAVGKLMGVNTTALGRELKSWKYIDSDVPWKIDPNGQRVIDMERYDRELWTWIKEQCREWRTTCNSS